MIESVFLLGFCSAAVSVLIGREQITESIRQKVVEMFGDHEKLYLIADLFHCPYCLNWWVSAGLMLVFFDFSIVVYLAAQAVSYITIGHMDKS